MRCLSARKIEHYFVDIAPAPPFRWIKGFDDRVFCRRNAALDPTGEDDRFPQGSASGTSGRGVYRSPTWSSLSVVFPAGANDRCDGAEDLVPRQRHVVGYIGEHMRRQNEALRLSAR